MQLFDARLKRDWRREEEGLDCDVELVECECNVRRQDRRRWDWIILLVYRNCAQGDENGPTTGT